MQPNKKLEIYPTSRAIRERIFQNPSQDLLLPKTVTIGEFESKVLRIPNRTFVDEDTKILLMQEASDFRQFRELQIEREFFSFLKNSQYLFSFFEELAVEMVTIDQLQQSDTYASYHEHLLILRQLQQNYIRLLDARKLVDKMTLPSLYQLNTRYISSFEQIDLYLEGYLNRFEQQLFTQIAEHVPLFIHLHTNRFNQKMTDTFRALGFALEADHYYVLDIQAKQILEATPKAAHTTHYHVSSTQNAVEEVAFVKKKIYDFVQAGYSPEEIIVIIPKASRQMLLELYDDENNFNFAMGFPFSQHPIYQKLDALYRFYTDPSFENSYRIGKLGYDPQTVKKMQKKWSQKLTPSEMIEILQDIIPAEESDAYRLYEEAFLLFGRLLPTLSHYPFHKVLHLFLNRLAKLTLDDTRGGRITVMEILETRGIQKRAVIVTDFNEGILPSSSRKDLFLSTAIRQHAGLPTPQDRENLQKYYYRRLFEQADDVAICYIEDEQNQPSRFLHELGIPAKTETFDTLTSILYPKVSQPDHYIQEDLVAFYDFSAQPLSASGLKTFLDCRRKFYFQYIRKLGEFEIPKEQDDQRIIGNILHDALKAVYSQNTAYHDDESLMLALQRALYLRSEESASLRFLVDVWLQRLRPFVRHEIRRFSEGFRVQSVEESIRIRYDHLQLKGTIDRIDIIDNRYHILDYKSGTIPKTTSKSLEKTSDFQLQFYYLLTQTKGEVAGAFYYDLAQGVLVDEPLFDQKLELLYGHFETLGAKEYNFTMTQERSKCLYCPYQKICNRIM